MGKFLKIQEYAKNIDKEPRSIFHTYTTKAMFLCKRARPNIYQAIQIISSRVKYVNKVD